MDGQTLGRKMQEEENRDLLSKDKRTIWVGSPPLHPSNSRKLRAKLQKFQRISCHFGIIVKGEVAVQRWQQ